MGEQRTGAGEALTERRISEAVNDLGWRYVLDTLRASVRVESLGQGSDVAACAVAAAGDRADESLSVDLRRDRIVLTLQSLTAAAVTAHEIELARRVSAAMSGLGLRTDAEVAGAHARSVQIIEIAIDALEIPSIRPFWKAVMGYGDQAGRSGPDDPLIDPVGQGPAIWFQQMNAPRPQRNRIHLDLSVPHDEAHHRINAALEAGGVLVSDGSAPAFWVLADAEGNEVCISTWQGRDGGQSLPL
jgi:4a-hydroxytetrahydrobiopterin dehydratase